MLLEYTSRRKTRRKHSKKHRNTLFSFLALICIAFTGIGTVSLYNGNIESDSRQNIAEYCGEYSLSIPEYSGNAYVTINDNIPFFTKEEITTSVFENYSEQDSLGRCHVAYANICKELMPTEERGKIGNVKPAGWHSTTYDFVEGKHLYNRCHLIGFQLAGENANEKNLITGTRYFNVVGMLPFESIVADYVEETNYHVLYRVTPVYEGDNLLADGVLMEAYSVEDEGDGICFNVFVYNVQPGVIIDYKTGDSHPSDT